MGKCFSDILCETCNCGFVTELSMHTIVLAKLAES